MKVLRVCHSFYDGGESGAGQNPYFHCKYSSHQNYVFTLSKSKIAERPFESTIVERFAVTPVQVNNQVFRFLFIAISQCLFLFKVTKKMHTIRPSVVHLYSCSFILIGLYARLFLKSRIIISIHGTDFVYINKFKPFYLIFSIAHKVGFVSKNQMRSFKYFHRKCFYMGNSANENIFKPIQRAPAEHFFINVGRLTWEKNQLLLLSAFERFNKSNPECKLYIVGEGPMRSKLQHYIKLHGLEHAVSLLGQKTQPEINGLLNNAVATVSTSSTEAAPKFIIESLFAYTPVIATDVGDSAVFVGEAGCVVDRTEESISSAMSVVYRYRADFSEATKRQAANFSWEQVGLRLEAEYG